MWFSHKREFRVDYGGAHLAGKQNMIAALQRLQSLPPAPLPEKNGGIWYSRRHQASIHDQPPLEERIAALNIA